VVLNAGAAIYAAGLSDSLAAGVDKAREVISSRAAEKKLNELVQLTSSMQ
jgi:anthranilate phosphoribosyltransferase